MTGEVSTDSIAVTSHDVNSSAAPSVDCQQIKIHFINTETKLITKYDCTDLKNCRFKIVSLDQCAHI